jgi:nucleotide-binding universal stress UspA family protein
MYDQILYPVDGSDSAEDAMDHVRDLAETYRATVHVLYVITAGPPAVGIGDDPNRESGHGMVGDPDGAETPRVGDRELHEEFRTRARAHGEERVEEVAYRLRGVDTHTAVCGGDPHQVVVDYADDEDVDLIVMGTDGGTGLRRQLLGSVAERVLRRAGVPVMTVREPDVDLLELDATAD